MKAVIWTIFLLGSVIVTGIVYCCLRLGADSDTRMKELFDDKQRVE